jgi:hypothetical protein
VIHTGLGKGEGTGCHKHNEGGFNRYMLIPFSYRTQSVSQFAKVLGTAIFCQRKTQRMALGVLDKLDAAFGRRSNR